LKASNDFFYLSACERAGKGEPLKTKTSPWEKQGFAVKCHEESAFLRELPMGRFKLRVF
jgi:hypothetical protein